MKLLFVGILGHQHISNFSGELKRIGFDIFGFDLAGNYKPENNKSTPFSKVWVKPSCGKNSFFNLLCKHIGSLLKFSQIKEKIDVVQFHYIDSHTLPLIIISRIKGFKASCFVYGSDFLHANKWQKKYLSSVFKYANSIVCDSVTLKEKLLEFYPNYSTKIESINFGSVIIDELYQKVTNTKKTSYLLDGHKMTIMCGYNGSKAQNHFRIIESISSLYELKNDIYLLFPMTYSCEKEYIREVDEKLKATGIEYRILSSFIPDKEWEEYIWSTDIFVHMQDSDAFSSTMAEHLLIGNVVVNATWLEYGDLSENDIYYLKSDFDSLADILRHCFLNYEEEYEKHMLNRQKIVKLKSLKYCCENYWKPYFMRII